MTGSDMHRTATAGLDKAGLAMQPSQLGRYDVLERLGAGSMGVVYKGFDPLIGRRVAVKVIRSDLLKDQEASFRKRFRHEVCSAGRCAHPGIVSIFDFVDHGDELFIVMEYVDGSGLQHLLANEALPADQAVDYTLQLLAALSHAHDHGVVHRDIKPSNIMVTASSKVKITDFGAACADPGQTADVDLLLGTPNYMAPEQVRGALVDARTDLFAVGMVLLRMLTGSLPYGEGNIATVLHRLASPDPIDLSQLRSLHPQLAAVTAHALAKDPVERFESALDFSRSLQQALAVSLAPKVFDRAEGQAPAQGSCDGTMVLDLPKSTARQHDPPLCPQLAEIAPRLTAILVDTIGPVAGLLVKRTAVGCTTPEALIFELCLKIENDAIRARFAKAVRSIATFDDTLLPPLQPKSRAHRPDHRQASVRW